MGVVMRGYPSVPLYGDGDGYGDGYGDGNGNGYGDGNGNGNGYGDGYGYGYGDGNGNGNGYGDGYGYGYGDGNGNGYGDGYGYGYGDGNGNGDGEAPTEYWVNSIQSVIADKDINVTDDVILAYWRSNNDGTPANGGSGTKAVPGLIEEIEGPLEICTKNALHGTLMPTKWKGDKVWVVALYPPFQFQEDKVASLKRQIVCEAGFKL